MGTKDRETVIYSSKAGKPRKPTTYCCNKYGVGLCV